MKNKIAIEYLKDMLASAEANLHVPDMAEYAEALNMAIEALSNSQKQTNSLIRTGDDDVSEADVIYRQDAIDALMVWEEDSVWDDECLKHRGKSYAPSDVIKDLPSADPKTADSGSVEKEMSENKTDRTIGDLISRQDAIYHCRKRLYQTAEVNRPIEVYADIAENRIDKWLNELPSAQRTGEWIEFDSDEDKYDIIKCPCCKHTFTVDSYHWTDIGFVKDDFKFCPNCGAKMRTKGDDNHDI